MVRRRCPLDGLWGSVGLLSLWHWILAVDNYLSAPTASRIVSLTRVVPPPWLVSVGYYTIRKRYMTGSYPTRYTSSSAKVLWVNESIISFEHVDFYWFQLFFNWNSFSPQFFGEGRFVCFLSWLAASKSPTQWWISCQLNIMELLKLKWRTREEQHRRHIVRSWREKATGRNASEDFSMVPRLFQSNTIHTE